MKIMHKIYDRLISFTYHTFDRIVIRGYLSSLTNCNNIVYFFKEVLGIKRIDKEALSKKTKEYKEWVESYAQKNRIPIEWAEKGKRKDKFLKPHRLKAKGKIQKGVYYIFRSMEQETTFRAQKPKYATSDPDYQIIQKTRSRFTHYYFYLIDPVLGPMIMRVATFLPFTTTYYLNGHSFMETQLQKQMIAYRKKDNAFLAVSDPKLLQQVADGFSYQVIKNRLDYWTWVLGPKFSRQERELMGLDRFYSVSQVEYCFNFIFKRNFPIRRMFERACDIGLIRMTADRIAEIFGQRITKRFKGKLQTNLERFDHGYFVFRAYFKNSFLKQYEKFFTFLRNELVCNNLKNFSLKKSLAHLDVIKKKFIPILNRFTDFQATSLNNHFDIDLLTKLSAPIIIGKTKISGLKLDNKRINRLLETLLHAKGNMAAWKSNELYSIILKSFRLQENQYSLNQLRYDLRKLKAHGIIQRIQGTYGYQLTEYGIKISLTFTIFHKKIFGPISNSLLYFKPNPLFPNLSKLEKQYSKIDREINSLLELLSA